MPADKELPPPEHPRQRISGWKPSDELTHLPPPLNPPIGEISARQTDDTRSPQLRMAKFWLHLVPSVGVSEGHRGALAPEPQGFDSLAEAQSVPVPQGFTARIEGPDGSYVYVGGHYQRVGGTALPLIEKPVAATESRPTGVKAEAASFAPPPSSLPGVAVKAEAGSFHSVPVTSEPAASTASTTVELTARSIGLQDTFARRLSERTAKIRDAARALSKAISDQIEQLTASTPNDESLMKHNDFVAFLLMIAAGLAQLTDALDRAIDTGTNGSPEPMLLGKAGEIARQLGNAVNEGLERNRTYIVDCTIKFGVCAAGFVFLQDCGMGEYAASFLAAIMNLRLPKERDSTK